ncbi:MAG: methylamine utilization protein MauE [Gammaproteobacteria bacterium]|nr:methylamine utilization protein MauE [Gammaproteobacteria bacterium]
MLDWIVHSVAVGTLALVFGLALSHKLRAYARFRASLQAYGIVPEFLLGVATPLIVALEAAALVCLFLPGVPGSLLAFATLGIYTVAMGVNLARGRRYIDCGCGDLPTPLSSWLLLRNGLLMALAWPYGLHAGYVASPAAWLLAGAVVLVLVVFYLTMEQLLANTGVVGEDHG